MKKIVLIILLIMALFGCQKKMNSLSTIESNDVNKIIVTLAMGNPEYGANSKTIIDRNEISEFINVFNNGYLGDIVKNEDIEIGDISTYNFYKDEEIILSFSFNVNNTEIVWHNDCWRYVIYPENSLLPFELYEQSTSKIVLVDEDGKAIEPLE